MADQQFFLSKRHNILSKCLNVTVHQAWLTLSISAQGLICSGQVYSFVQTFLERSASVWLFHCFRSNQTLIPHHKYLTWLIFAMPCKATERGLTLIKEKRQCGKSQQSDFFFCFFGSSAELCLILRVKTGQQNNNLEERFSISLTYETEQNAFKCVILDAHQD